MFVPLSAVQGVVVVGYGSGHIRLFSLEDGHIMCEVSSTVQYSTVQYSTVQNSLEDCHDGIGNGQWVVNNSLFNIVQLER